MARPMFGGRGQRLNNKTLVCTLKVKLVTAVSGARDLTLVNIPLPVLAETAPRGADQEPAK